MGVYRIYRVDGDSNGKVNGQLFELWGYIGAGWDNVQFCGSLKLLATAWPRVPRIDLEVMMLCRTAGSRVLDGANKHSL